MKCTTTTFDKKLVKWFRNFCCEASQLYRNCLSFKTSKLHRNALEKNGSKAFIFSQHL